MDGSFAGSELIELSIQIERNGLAFYSELSRASRDPVIGGVFAMLAGEEEKHISAFKKICAQMEGCGSPEVSTDEYIAYMNALASEHVFTRRDEGERIAREIRSDQEALDKAIGFEKDSIIFYEGMRGAVAPGDAVVVDALIAQEKMHLTKLVNLKSKKG